MIYDSLLENFLVSLLLLVILIQDLEVSGVYVELIFDAELILEFPHPSRKFLDKFQTLCHSLEELIFLAVLDLFDY